MTDNPRNKVAKPFWFKFGSMKAYQSLSMSARNSMQVQLEQRVNSKGT
jgi:hypothetical protein